MAFQPDILITTPGGRIMVIEAKVAMDDLPRTEEALKRYMVGMQYPFGLLITPEKGWVYRDLYSGLSPESVKRVGEFNATQMWRHEPPRQALEFEAFVQQWIQDLADFPAESLPAQLKDIIQDYVLPAMAIGEVTAAHPR
ncbi:MAG TPA: hypothetical protein VGP68_22725 [Gemmataceae bacterium]|jgi:hypothetical protein|nr:hypothetical protein [Gemmataceae bacterium]